MTTPRNPVVHTLNRPAVVERKLEQITLADDLVIYKLSFNTNFNGRVSKSFKAFGAEKSSIGFATPDAVEKYLKGKTASIAHKSKFQVVPDGYLTALQQEGFSNIPRELSDAAPKPEQWFELFANGELSLNNVVQIDFSTHETFDRHGVILPAAYYFDYMTGNMRDGAYDLNAAAEYLAKHPRVRPTPKRSGRQKVNAAGEAVLAVETVPHYNASRGCHCTLDFIFSPTREEMIAIHQKCISYGTTYPSTERYRAIFDLDILGLRAAGIALHEDYYSTEPAGIDSDDEDDSMSM